MDRDKLASMLMDHTIPITDILAEELADDFIKTTGSNMPKRDIVVEIKDYLSKDGNRPTAKQISIINNV